METKSRYEVISDLEEKKAGLLNQKANVGFTEATLNRNIEMAQKELDDFTDGKKIQEENIKDQLESIEKSLDRLNSPKK